MKYLKQFENADYFNIIKNHVLELNKLKEIIKDYISYTENYNPSGFFVIDIDFKDDKLIVITDSNNNSYMSFHYGYKDRENINLFINDPELFKNSKKYNI